MTQLFTFFSNHLIKNANISNNNNILPNPIIIPKYNIEINLLNKVRSQVTFSFRLALNFPQKSVQEVNGIEKSKTFNRRLSSVMLLKHPRSITLNTLGRNYNAIKSARKLREDGRLVPIMGA